MGNELSLNRWSAIATHLRLLGIFVTAPLLPQVLLAQGVVEITGPPTCSSCTVQLEKVAELGGPGTDFLLSRVSNFARDEKGNFYVSSVFQPGTVGVFDSKGKFIRAIGRRGSGPGEFAEVGMLFGGKGDTVYVFDSAVGSYSKMTSTGSFISSAPVKQLIGDQVAMLSGERTVVKAGGQRGLSDWSLTFFDKAGATLSKYAAPAATPRPAATALNRVLVPDISSNGVLVLNTSRLEISFVDSSAHIIKRIVRNEPWFEPWEALPLVLPYRAATKPYVHGAVRDSAGLLHVLVTVAQEKFKARTDSGPVAVGAMGMYLDTMIEVMDLRVPSVVVAQRFEDWLHAVPGTDLVYAQRSNEDGIISCDIYRVRVQRR